MRIAIIVSTYEQCDMKIITFCLSRKRVYDIQEIECIVFD